MYMFFGNEAVVSLFIDDSDTIIQRNQPEQNNPIIGSDLLRKNCGAQTRKFIIALYSPAPTELEPGISLPYSPEIIIKSF